MTARRYAAPLAALLLTLTACGTDDQPGARSSSPAPTRSSVSDSATPHPDASATPGGDLPAGGTATRPNVVEAGTDLLDWQQVPGSVDDTVTRSGDWTLTVNKAGSRADLEGPNSSSGSGSTGERVSDALIDGHYAVVVSQDKQEQRPSTAQVTDLDTGKQFQVDGSSDVPTTSGGTWALGQGRLLHATVRQGAYCLASVDLPTRTSTLGWCAPKRHGFNGARITPAGESMLTFDDASPSCRTIVTVVDTGIQPFPGVPDCKGWDGLLTDDGAVWSVVPKENQVESAHFYARTADGYYDLGPGTSGSLTWCGDAAYFVRDPQRDGDPARLMRWRSTDGLQAVYESPGGQAFLAAPRCGGDTMTLTTLAQERDEQVSATVR